MIFEDIQKYNDIVTNISKTSNIEDVVKSLKDYSEAEQALIISKSNLTDAAKLAAQADLAESAAKNTNTSATHINSAAQATNMTVVDALKLKYQKLANSIGISTVALTKFIAVAAGITIAVAVFNHFYDTAEETKEKVDDLMNSFDSALKTANDNMKTVDGLADRYEELSSGVNNLGENVSLSTDEFAEYNDIVNKIASMSPKLVAGYTAEGNAILSLKGNAEELRDVYKEAQQEAYNLLIATGEDTDGNDIVKQYSYLSQDDLLNSDILGRTAFNEKAKKEMADLIAQSKDIESFMKDLNSLFRERDYTSNEVSDFIRNEIGLKIGNYNAGKDGFNDTFEGKTLTSEDLSNIKQKAKAVSQTYQAAIDDALSDVRTLANAYLETNVDYAKLDEESKTAASIIVNSLNENIADDFEESVDVGEYVQKIVDIISKNPDAKEAMIGLMSLDTSDMPLGEAKQWIDSYINTIATLLEENPAELKVRLGFTTVDDLHSNLQQVNDDAISKFSGVNSISAQYDSKAREIYNQEKEILEQFAKENSINTQDEIAFWNQCIEESRTKEAAMKKYLEESPTEATSSSLFDQLTASKEAIDTFTSSVQSAYDAYSTLMNPTLSSTNILSSIQAINEAMTSMGGTLNWEVIDGATDPLKALEYAIERVSETYAQSVLADAGIDVNSEFGQMLANNIIQAQKASTQLDVLNGQIDSLQTAYTDLTDIVDTYNKTGKLTFDQLQTLLEMEPQYLACLVDENGQLQLNEQAMLALAHQRLNDAETQAIQQAIAELGQLTLQNETTAVKENGQAFQDQVSKLSAYNTELANTLAIASVSTGAIYDLNAAISGAESNGATESQIGTVLNNLEAKLQLIGKTREGLSGGLGSIMGGSGASEAETDWKKLLDAELDLLEKQLAVGLITFDDYLNKRRNLIEDYYADGKLSAAEYYEYLEKHYENQLSYMDKVINAVTRKIDKEIDKLKKQQEDIEEHYSVQIEYLEEQKTALEEANAERQRQINLQKALYELERAQNQRTTLMYSEEKGMHYVADGGAIRDAQQEAEDAEFEMKISEIEKAITKLEEARDRELEAIDEMIERLEEYKEYWEEITTEYEYRQEELLASQILGQDWEKQILEGRLDTLEKFKDNYIAIQQAIADAAYQAALATGQDANQTTITDTSKGKTSSLEPDAGAENSENSDDAGSTWRAVNEETGDTTGPSFTSKQGAESYAKGLNQKKAKAYNMTLEEFLGSDIPAYYVRKIEKYHTGLEKGLVGSHSFDDDFKLVQKVGLGQDEVPAILQKKEAVVTQDQISNLADGLRMPSYLQPLSSDSPLMKMVKNFEGLFDGHSPIFDNNIVKQMGDAMSKLANTISNTTHTQEIHQTFNITMPVTNETTAITLMRDLESLATKKLHAFNNK